MCHRKGSRLIREVLVVMYDFAPAEEDHDPNLPDGVGDIGCQLCVQLLHISPATPQVTTLLFL